MLPPNTAYYKIMEIIFILFPKVAAFIFLGG
jgi:hypothetical protein